MKVLFSEIRAIAKEALDEERYAEFQFDMDIAEQHVFDWKAHLMRAVHQDTARTEILAQLKPGESAFILMDFAMKWYCKYNLVSLVSGLFSIVSLFLGCPKSTERHR